MERNAMQSTAQRVVNNDVFALLAKMKPAIQAALPRHLTPDRMLRMATTCIKRTPKLVNCDPMSVIGCIVELSQLGLEPSTPLGHAWILPYGTRAQVIIGYKGFISLADRSGIRIRAEVVRADDVFDYQYGTDERLMHKPYDGDGDAPLKYAYAIARFPDGTQMFRVVTGRDIARAKASSSAARGSKDSPWTTDPDQMWRKTAVRRLAPFLPLSAEFVRAVALDESADRGAQELSTDVIEAVGEAIPSSEEMHADAIESSIDAAKQIMSGPAPEKPGGTETVGDAAELLKQARTGSTRKPPPPDAE